MKTKNELIDLINAHSEPMQFTYFFTSRERRLLRQAAIDNDIVLYKHENVLYVKRTDRSENRRGLCDDSCHLSDTEFCLNTCNGTQQACLIFNRERIRRKLNTAWRRFLSLTSNRTHAAQQSTAWINGWQKAFDKNCSR